MEKLLVMPLKLWKSPLHPDFETTTNPGHFEWGTVSPPSPPPQPRVRYTGLIGITN